MIEFLISTMNRSDLSFLDNIFRNIKDQNYHVLVVNQCTKIERPLIADTKRVRVVSVSEKGLSKSRNLALKHAKGDYVVICDDDVVYDFEVLTNIKNAIDNRTCDFYSFQYVDIVADKKQYLSKETTIKKSLIFSISSVELVFRLSSIKDHNLCFDELFGVGSAGYPMGEENIFVNDALKVGLKGCYIPQVILTHVGDTTGESLRIDYFTWLNKGKLFTRLYGLKGIFVAPLLAMKNRKEFRLTILFKIMVISFVKGVVYYFKKK